MFTQRLADDDVVGAMMECHERIRTFVEGLRRIAALDDLGDPRAADAAQRCARYFREGLPLHGKDEDDSLAPRLRATHPGADVESALARMTAQHGEMEEILPRLLPMLDAIAAGERPDHEALRGVVARFTALMIDHVELEEAVIFPACGAIPSAERTRIRVEMRERRA
ncbi:MAG: hemerythrin domain-containing protein [Myxococcota bacterium]